MLARFKKIIAAAGLVAGSFHSGYLFALGLGELTVNSSLNEPLDATIQILGVDGLTAGQIQTAMGSLDDFQRANLSRVGLIDNIRMEVQVLNAERGILRLTSTNPVVEPFVNFVISVRWPNGRLMRDYTALIDLPVFITDEPQAAPVDAPQAPAPRQDEEQPRPQQPETRLIATDEPAPRAVEQQPRAEPAPASAGAAQDSVTVAAGDTLYGIAAANRPDNSVTVEQTMLAIQRANPGAFSNDNINNLRVGQVLRLPALQDIRSVDQAQAVRQIALQNQASSAQPLALSTNNGNAGQQGTDELTILSGDAGDSVTGDNDLAATIAALENRLAISEESLDRARLENQELRARYAELEEQIEILQNIIAMQDARLAELQAGLAANTAEPETPAAPEPQPEPVAAQPAPQDSSLMGQVSAAFENTLVLIGSLVALIVLVLGFLVWRRRAAMADMDDFEISGGAVAVPASQAFTADETEGSSGGFLAGLKARFTKDPDDDDEDAEPDDDDEVDELDEEEGGLLARLKGLFRRKDTDEDDDYIDDEEDLDEIDEQDDEPEADEADDLLDDDLDDADDGDDVIENLAESDWSDAEEDDEESPEVDDETGSDDDSTEAVMDFDDLVTDDADEEAETVEASAEDVLDLGDFDLDEDAAEDTAETTAEQAEEFEFDLGDDASLADDADEDENAGSVETFDFSLGDDAAPAAASAEEEEAGDVESFDFSMDDLPAVESPAEAAAGDVESFEFSVDDAPSAPEPVADTASDAEEEVESLAFDVSSVSSFEEEPAETTDDADEDVETFSFDSTPSAGSGIKKDSLSAALDEIDAEAESKDDDDIIELEGDFDLGNIDIDDSLFDSGNSSAAEPIGDRDEASTKLDLAVAYEAMGDLEGAREILGEVINEGSDEQVTEAKKLLEKWDKS